MVQLMALQLSPSEVPHPSLNASPTLEILLIALKAEQVSSMNAANDCIISLLTGYIRNLCHWFCNHLCVNRLKAWMSAVIFLHS